MSNPNEGAPTQQMELWNGPSGEAWVALQPILDQAFDGFAERLAARVSAETGRHILDIGCGTGASTLAAARAAGPGGHCTGVDISAPMVALARSRATEAGLDADFIVADAQDHAFAAASFDLAISRFGVMFFDDSVRAFANIRRAMTVGGEISLFVWRKPEDNDFMRTGVSAARNMLPDLPRPDPDAPGQFAFANRDKVAGILAESGWSDILIEPIDVACTFRESDLMTFLTRIGPLGRALDDIEPATREHVLAQVWAAYDPFIDGDMVRFVAGCWAISARA